MNLENNILTLREGEELTIRVASSEEYPCTDNAGKDIDPIILNYNKGDVEFDSLFVKNAIIQEKSNWCKCEIIGQALKYTALEENPTNEDRVTYFEHKTNDALLIIGANKGKPAMKSWIVTIKQKANPNIKDKQEETQQQTQEVDQSSKLGKYLYSVGLLSDVHMCKANDNATPNDTSDDWGDEEDFKACMKVFVNDKNVKFIASCGDIAESQTNDYQKHPEAVCDVDYSEFKEMYDVPYWQSYGMRFFSPLGNHDFYGLFESRYGDTITGKKNSEAITGYNANVSTRIGKLWPTDGGINGIVPGVGRIVFELESGKSSVIGQADMNFFSFNDYVDLYAKKGGYTGAIWDSSKGGISDEAIKYAKNYVNSNWSTIKDNLTMWNDSGSHGRNCYSKLNYWMKKGNDLFIFLSVDYGNDVWGLTSGWHDRMIHARTIINLNDSDPYIKRMKEYVADTEYSEADKPYNYQYYSPNTLIWLKEVLENNQDKKIYIFTHHSLPNKVGNSIGIPQNGDWQYADISKDGEGEGINKGSNMLTGIEYWFLNKLNNKYKNTIWFSGHSHISWDNDNHFINKDYEIISPSNQNNLVYSRTGDNYKTESAWNVALPSMSKPRYIGTNGKSSRLYDDAEIGIMEIYENGVKIKGYKVKEKNKDVSKLLVEKTIILK